METILFFIEYKAYPNQEYIHDFPFFNEFLYPNIEDALKALFIIKDDAEKEGYKVDQILNNHTTVYLSDKISVDCYVAQRLISLSDI